MVLTINISTCGIRKRGQWKATVVYGDSYFFIFLCLLSMCKVLKENKVRIYDLASVCLWLHWWLYWALPTILKTNKKVNEVMYFDSKSIHILKVYSIHYFNWDKAHMLKAFPLDKINGTKMPSFFFRELQFITVLLLICDSYMNWSTWFVSLKVCVSLKLCNSVSFLLKSFFKKKYGRLDFNTPYFLSKLK